MAIWTMEDKGTSKVSWRLNPPPSDVFQANRRRAKPGAEVEPFEPYEESLPLQSGWYSFVLDDEGRFRIKRGNTSSHASMVGGQPAAGAGRFRVSRMGRVAEVFCQSIDYSVTIKSTDERWILYLIRAFAGHPALNTHPLAVFVFRRWGKSSLYLDSERRPVLNVEDQLAIIDREGLGDELVIARNPFFNSFVPESPPKLYGMHLDQSICDLESDGDDGIFEKKEPEPRLSPEVVIKSGKLNFVIDEEGYLIVGSSGHQILSGGHHVAGAGHLTFEPDGGISSVDLNFSGHYRPPLTVDYASYVYRAISTHPLLKIKSGCKFSGRKFINLESTTRMFLFSESDLKGENPDLEMEIDIFD